MVRTKADGGGGSSGSRKAVGGSAPRKALGGAGSSSAGASPSGKNAKYGGGNPAIQRPTPDWQKGIGSFLSPGKSKVDKENAQPSDDVEITGSSEAGCSKDIEAGSSKDS
ncbi:PCNA-associated factor-like [Mya arenaria]|uniref:PCNA-associated factor-like n=1 Tax=Mya arenaria TaxID=6604 RepID=UPI0022E4DD79|nr:PCNA-associated factor-like [Mya arenaria]